VVTGTVVGVVVVTGAIWVVVVEPLEPPSPSPPVPSSPVLLRVVVGVVVGVDVVLVGGRTTTFFAVAATDAAHATIVVVEARATTRVPFVTRRARRSRRSRSSVR
jgi:hypothetical protein